MDLQEAFDAGFVAVKAYVDDALASQQKALPDLVKAAVAEAVAGLTPPKDGKDADPVAPELVAEVVAAFMDANPPAAGEPGKDADPEVIRELVAEAVAALPPPEAREVDMTEVARMVVEEVAKVPAPKDGSDADPEHVRTMVAEAVAALPPAEPGKDADPEVIRSMVAEAVEALPPAQPGKDAEPVTSEQIDAAVLRHIEANPIKTVTPEDLEPVVAGHVAKAVDAIPPAKDGQDAAQIASFVKDHAGSLIVTLSDGRVIDTGIRDGAKGDPGRDALTLSDFDTELSADGRILTLCLENGEMSVRHELQLPVMIYRGGYKEGVEYVEGDTVTFGGSLWCCSAPTTDKPIEGRECWRLAARKGRDGKDAKAPA